MDVLAAQVRDGLYRRDHMHVLVNPKDCTLCAPHAALDALVARVTETERREHGLNDDWLTASERAAKAEAALADARNALEQYANPQHWAIDRVDFAHPKCIWIGPGADERVPNAPKVAREVLARLDGNQP